MKAFYAYDIRSGAIQQLIGRLDAAMVDIDAERESGIADYRLFFFGSILVAMMLFRPQGLCGSPRHWRLM